MKTRVLIKGDSLEFSFDRGGDSMDDWVCTLNVLQFPGDTPAISRVIESSTNSSTGEEEWAGFITAAESALLTNSTSPNANGWQVIGKLVNSTTGEQETVVQGSTRFSQSPTWV